MRSGTVPALVGLVGLGGVAGARRPQGLRWPWFIANAVTSGFASEVPALMIGAHVLAAAAALRGGGVARVAGLALNAGALAGLAGLLGDAGRSAELLADALREVGVPPDLSFSEHGPFGARPRRCCGSARAPRRSSWCTGPRTPSSVSGSPAG